MGRKPLIVRDYFEHEATMNYCAPIPHIDIHGDFLMSVIQVFAVAAVAFKILFCPFNFVFCPLEPIHLPLTTDAASFMRCFYPGKNSDRIKHWNSYRIKHWLF